MNIGNHRGGRQQRGIDLMPGHSAARALRVAQINVFLETYLHSSACLCAPSSPISKTEILLRLAACNPPTSYVKLCCCFVLERSSSLSLSLLALYRKFIRQSKMNILGNCLLLTLLDFTILVLFSLKFPGCLCPLEELN